MNYIDLFAGAGGLSEGFVRQGFNPIAHVEMNQYACDTLKTRMVYHFLKKEGKITTYYQYLKGEIPREDLWSSVPQEIIDSVINMEISEESISILFEKVDSLLKDKKIDLIIGGPPCQAYSLVGRARDPHKMEHDPRNFLYKLYVRFLDKYKPKLFVFENVPGILSAKNGEHFSNIKRAILDSGYNMESKILNAHNFGVLQNRKRVIIIGWKNDLKLNYPDFTFLENKHEILKDLFYDLPKLNPGEAQHIAHYTKEPNSYLKESQIRNGLDFTTQHIVRPHNSVDLEIYKIAINQFLSGRKRLNYTELPERLKKHNNQKAFLNRFQVVDPLGSSHTVVAHIAKDGHYYIYPSLEQIRSISIREAARVQSFPDDFHFEGSRSAAFKQIGNAVPPLMANEIAKKIKELL